MTEEKFEMVVLGVGSSNYLAKRFENGVIMGTKLGNTNDLSRSIFVHFMEEEFMERLVTLNLQEKNYSVRSLYDHEQTKLDEVIRTWEEAKEYAKKQVHLNAFHSLISIKY